MKYRWHIAPAQPLLVQPLAARLGISPLLAQCLVNRGLSDPAAMEAFLEPRLKNLADPFLLPNMAAAVDRLLRAHCDAEPLVVYGDYDVDGVTSTTLMLEVLRRLGWSVEAYLPHRLDEGYGLTRAGAENCLKKYPVRLILAVDCGSTAVETIGWLRERGVETIVLDHHQVSNPAPAAVALVNPQLALPGQDPAVAAPATRTFTELCSVGIAFKLAHALLKRGRETGLPGAAEFDLKTLLDLVALGTIADLVPLTGENRIFVTAGLARLSTTERPGLVALKKVAGTAETVSAVDVGFQLGPRLNASGRLETAEESLHLLLADTLAAAQPLAENLDARNRERQKIERGIADEAAGMVRCKFNPETDFVIVEGQLLWHIGVVGIVASRVLAEFYRPTIILGGDAGEWRGSGRSIAGFDLAAALRACADLLIKHGGHAMAAGLTISPDNIDALRQRLNDLARRQLKPADLQPPLRLDGEVSLRDLTLDFIEELDQLKPTGQGNPALQFCARNLTHKKPVQRMGADHKHVKMWVTDGTVTHEAVWWNAGGSRLPVGIFDLAFSPAINEYNDRKTVQLKVLDWRDPSA